MIRQLRNAHNVNMNARSSFFSAFCINVIPFTFVAISKSVLCCCVGNMDFAERRWPVPMLFAQKSQFTRITASVNAKFGYRYYRQALRRCNVRTSLHLVSRIFKECCNWSVAVKLFGSTTIHSCFIYYLLYSVSALALRSMYLHSYLLLCIYRIFLIFSIRCKNKKNMLLSCHPSVDSVDCSPLWEAFMPLLEEKCPQDGVVVL